MTHFIPDVLSHCFTPRPCGLRFPQNVRGFTDSGSPPRPRWITTPLKRIAVNRVRSYFRGKRHRPSANFDSDSDQFVSQLEDPASELSRRWHQDHDEHLFQKLIAMVKPDLEDQTWLAFTRFALDGQSAAEVAKEPKHVRKRCRWDGPDAAERSVP